MTGLNAEWPRLMRFPLNKGLLSRAIGEGVGARDNMKVTAGDDILRAAFEGLEFPSILEL